MNQCPTPALSLALSLVVCACTGAQSQGSSSEERPVVAPTELVTSSPPPTTSDPDPRFVCTRDEDCVSSCWHGAVARTWYEATYPDGETCEDGCTSKGTEPPVCVSGGCVARRMGKDDPLCTRVDREPMPSVRAPASGAPLTIEALHGFVEVERAADATTGRLRHSSPPGSGCMVDTRWWRPMPPDPGAPMVEASRRPVTVDGRATHVITTSMFEGVEQQVDVVFLRGESYQIRIVFESCGSTEEDGFLEGTRVTG